MIQGTMEVIYSNQSFTVKQVQNVEEKFKMDSTLDAFEVMKTRYRGKYR